MIKIGIIGSSGYATGELCRLLFNHPEAELIFVHSKSYNGLPLTDIYEGLFGETDLCFTDELPFEEVDVVFFCLPQGQSSKFLEENYIPADVHIIDLAPDFRQTDEDNDYVYGLPELNGPQIVNALHVANPGDFATCIQLGLLPLAESGLLKGDMMINAVIGSTIDDSMPAERYNYSYRNGNFSVLTTFNEEQIDETLYNLQFLQPDYNGEMNFIPYRGGFTRGLFATVSLKCDAPIEEIESSYEDFYSEAPFTHYIAQPLDMKQAVNTNKCLIHADKQGERLLITVCMDNLLKGSAGQAIQNMNLMFGLEETTGLRLKASAY